MKGGQLPERWRRALLKLINRIRAWLGWLLEVQARESPSALQAPVCTLTHRVYTGALTLVPLAGVPGCPHAAPEGAGQARTLAAARPGGPCSAVSWLAEVCCLSCGLNDSACVLAFWPECSVHVQIV